MLYFIGYNPSAYSWTGDFSRCVRLELKRRRIPYTELPPWDWKGASAPHREYLAVKSKPEDSWLIGWAQSPVIELIAHKKGLKYGFVVGLTKGHFDPLVLLGAREELRERERLNLYHKLFTSSRWCSRCIAKSYPELAGRIVFTGFPFDFTKFTPYCSIPKEEDLVVFNQRFSLERLHIIELELARRLVAKGFRAWHLTGVPVEKLSQADPSLAPLLACASEYGLKFVYNPDKHTYYRNLARASVVVTTSIADMLPSSLVEAVLLGAVPVAPQALCFPELVHSDNLYSPYDLEEITAMVLAKPKRGHLIANFAKEAVVGRMLAEIEQNQG